MAAVKLKFLRSPTPGPERGGEAQAGGAGAAERRGAQRRGAPQGRLTGLLHGPCRTQPRCDGRALVSDGRRQEAIASPERLSLGLSQRSMLTRAVSRPISSRRHLVGIIFVPSSEHVWTVHVPHDTRKEVTCISIFSFDVQKDVQFRLQHLRYKGTCSHEHSELDGPVLVALLPRSGHDRGPRSLCTVR